MSFSPGSRLCALWSYNYNISHSGLLKDREGLRPHLAQGLVRRLLWGWWGAAALWRDSPLSPCAPQIHMVYSKRSGKPRGYAFIEYEHERDMHCEYLPPSLAL